MLRVVLGLVVVVGVLGGCGAAEPAGPFPERPVEIDVGSVDPCTALTPAQQGELGVEVGDPTGARSQEGFGAGCLWNDYDSGFNYGLRIVEQPASVFVGSPGVVVQTLAGFGAVRSTAFEDSAPTCELYIDTSEVGSIRVQAQATFETEAGRPEHVEDVCSAASSVATTIVENLRGTG
ncbi:DUF3558 family protein [Pseudonocardia spirodelae]|uniref:DUF3558 family protein n=1 Tax=Pseudonocardia spirodelae TaxID=3133431 RepID=A0ABU8T6Z3_9PSEU